MMESLQNIVVLGAGESGVGAAILAKAKGYKIFVSDLGGISEKYRHELEYYQIEFEEKQHTEDRILAADCIIKSPGIADKSPMILKAAEREIPVISEIEWGGRFTDAFIIGITGTNGKTTTTSLTYHILKNGGLNVGLAGNIGKSFARCVAEEDYSHYVIELSSFQLDGIRDFRCNVAILLNITPDHLDRYEYKLENYIESKFKITMNQKPEDYFIYNGDDELIMEYFEKFASAAKRLPFSQEKDVFPGAYIKDDEMIIGINQQNEIKMKLEETSLKGKHNRFNTMAAGVAAKIVDIRKDVVRESLKSFENVEHRLEFVARVNGIDYINDSKATNVNSTWYALESMQHPVIWIAGGIDKGNNYESLRPLVKEKVKAIVCIGKDNSKLQDAFKDDIHKIVHTQSMKEAVRLATSFAMKDDIVLLAPACSSFDLFMNYEDRGRQFKNSVLSL